MNIRYCNVLVQHTLKIATRKKILLENVCDDQKYTICKVGPNTLILQ